jgi:hypothetical protein
VRSGIAPEYESAEAAVAALREKARRKGDVQSCGGAGGKAEGGEGVARGAG